jgi:hypothetical protein
MFSFIILDNNNYIDDLGVLEIELISIDEPNYGFDSSFTAKEFKETYINNF